MDKERNQDQEVSLKRLASELFDKEAKTREILNTIADGILVINGKKIVENCNTSIGRILGIPKENLIGKETSKIVIPVVEKNTKINSTHTLQSLLKKLSENYFHELPYVREGEVIFIEIYVSKISVEGEIITICLFRDITFYKHTQQRLALQHHVTMLLMEMTSLDEIAPKLLETICKVMHWDLGGYWKLDKREDLLKPIAFYKRYDFPNAVEFIDKSNSFNFKKGIGLPGTTWLKKSPYFIRDVVYHDNFPRAPWALNADLHSAYAFPILFSGEIVGVLEFFTRNFHNYDQHFLNVLFDIGTQIGISIEKQEAQKRVLELNQELIVAARHAGMMEVATGVLHNIGNVLNSVNTSASLLYEILKNSELKNLEKLVALLQEHKKDLGEFIGKDERGKYIPTYIEELFKVWQKEHHASIREIGVLTNNIEHIKGIVKMQQMFGQSIGAVEPVIITELMEDAIAIHRTLLEKTGIHIRRSYEEIPAFQADKIKLLQILVNLIHNAIDALVLGLKKDKNVTIKTSILDSSYVLVEVSDNGIGIKPENLSQLFQFGFTTKKKGHGFGLHASALAAREIGGELTATSDGIHRGATFSLKVPLRSL